MLIGLGNLAVGIVPLDKLFAFKLDELVSLPSKAVCKPSTFEITWL